MNKTKISANKIFNFKAISLMLLLAAVMFSAGNIYSQQDGNGEKKQKKTPEERAQKRADKMKDILSLSEDQHKQVYDIMLNHMNEKRSIWESSKNDQDKTARKEKMKAVRESTNTQINSLLSADQQKLWESHKKEMKEKHKGKMHNGNKHGKGNKQQK